MGQTHGRPIVYTDEVNLNHFKLLRVVGKGAFGKVRIVERRDDRLTFALKYIRKDEVVRAENVRNIIRERRMLEHLSHPFLCNLRYSFQDYEYLYLVVDLMNGGDLRFHISRKAFTESAVRFWIAELGCALRYIHSQGIVHRDVKPDNVLLDSDGHVHLADFNVAANFRERSLTSKSGTLAYLAPEVYKGKHYKSEVDWWGLGVLFYECIYGKRPFVATDTHELARQVMAGKQKYPNTNPMLDTACVSAIKRLMCNEIVDRIGAAGWETFTQHPFFVDIDFEALERKEIKPIFVPSSDRTNFDATYDLEELLLEDAPLEARARHQKPRPRLKSDATPQEMRCAELHTMIEKYFEPFDYKQSVYEKSKEELEATAKATLMTLPSEAGKIDVALSQARRISASSKKDRRASHDGAIEIVRKKPARKGPLPGIEDSRSTGATPSGSPPFNSQVDLAELMKSKPRNSDGEETLTPPEEDAVSPMTEIPNKRHSVISRNHVEIVPSATTSKAPSPVESPTGLDGTLAGAPSTNGIRVPSSSKKALDASGLGESPPEENKKYVRIAQRSMSVGHIGVLGRQKSVKHQTNNESSLSSVNDHSNHSPHVSGMLTGSTATPRETVTPPPGSNPPPVLPPGRAATALGRSDSDAHGRGRDKKQGLMSLIGRKKQGNSGNRKEQEPGVLGKLGARQILPG